MIFGQKTREPEVGQDVVTADEERLGDVATVHDEYLEVRGGTFDHPVTWRVPRTAIGKVDPDAIALRLSRGQVLAQGWAQGADPGAGLPAALGQ